MPTRITCTAKVSGYHPASGNHLVAGENFELNETEWSPDIFERPDPDWKSPSEQQTEGGTE